MKADRLKLNLEQVQQQKTRDNERLLLLLDDRSNITAAYMASRDKVKELRAAVAEREGQDTQAKELLDSLKKEIAKYGSAVTALDNQLQDAQITLQTSAARTAISVFPNPTSPQIRRSMIFGLSISRFVASIASC